MNTVPTITRGETEEVVQTDSQDEDGEDKPKILIKLKTDQLEMKDNSDAEKTNDIKPSHPAAPKMVVPEVVEKVEEEQYEEPESQEQSEKEEEEESEKEESEKEKEQQQEVW